MRFSLDEITEIEDPSVSTTATLAEPRLQQSARPAVQQTRETFRLDEIESVESQKPETFALDEITAIEEPRQAQPAPAETAPAPKPATFLGRVKDLGLMAWQGAIGASEAIVGAADLAATPVRAAIEGVTGAKIPTLAEGLKPYGFDPKAARETLEQYYTEQQQQANRSLREAKGLVDTAVTALSNPSTIVKAVVESAPSMVAGGMVGRAMTAAVPALGAVRAGSIGEGLVSAGQSAEQIRQEQGALSPQQAAVVAASGGATSLLGLFGGTLAKRLGIADVDTMIAGGLANPNARTGLVKAVVYGAAQEGFLEELPQSVQEQVASNYAAGRPLDQGVDQAAVMGTLAGVAMGGGSQMVSKIAERRPTTRVTNNDGTATRPQDASGATPGPVTPEPAQAPAQPQAGKPAVPSEADSAQTPQPVAASVPRGTTGGVQAAEEVDPEDDFGRDLEAMRSGAPPPSALSDKELIQAVAEAKQTQPSKPIGTALAPVEQLADVEPDGYYLVSPDALQVDAARFQFKGNADKAGVTPDARIEGPWNPNRAGQILAWRDPDTGRLYVVNGHHRLEAAQRLGAKKIAIKVLEPMSADAARVEGALTNIAEDKGTPVDAAKVLRAQNWTLEHLEKIAGINPRTRLARDGAALAQLSDPIFQRVATGEIDEAQAAAIGQAGLSPESQAAVIQLIERQAGKDRTLTPGQLKALIQDVMTSEEVTAESAQGNIFTDLFGEERKENTAVAKAELRDWLTSTLAKDRQVFAYVTKGDRAERLTSAGNKINVKGSSERAEEAGRAQAVVEKLAFGTGPINNALNDAAARIVRGEAAREVRNDLLAAVRDAVAAELAPATQSRRTSPGRPVRQEVDRPRVPASPARPDRVATEPTPPVATPAPDPTPAPEAEPASRGQLFDEPEPQDAPPGPHAPPKDRDAYRSRRAYNATLHATYAGGQSSRTTPQTAEIPPVGTWMIDDTATAANLQDVEQLVELPVDQIQISEDTGRARFDDVERYARWTLEGREAPPIRVVQTDKGTIKTMDHRRLLAAKAANQPTIKAWVSWSTAGETAHPVSLTFERAAAGAQPLPIAQSSPESTIFKDDQKLLDDLRRRLAETTTGPAEADSPAIGDDASTSEPSEPETKPETTPERAALIERIVAAARKPAPDIVESFEVKGTDGKWYSAGMPWGVSSTNERRSVGFVQRLPQGTTVGNRYPTPEAAREAIKAFRDRDEASFRAALEESSDERLQSQAEYWLKDQAPQPVSVTFSADHLQETFGLTAEQAEAGVALADAMGLDTDKIRLVKGGTPGSGAMPQDDLLSTGEIQPRLPGDVGSVRDLNIEQPKFELPPPAPPRADEEPARQPMALPDMPTNMTLADQRERAKRRPKQKNIFDSPDLLFQSAVNAKPLSRWYYSNIAQALDVWQNKGTVDQLLAHLKKFKGANEEAETIGFDAWLKDQKTVTKAEAQAWLQGHQIEVAEVVKGDDSRNAILQDIRAEGYDIGYLDEDSLEGDGGEYGAENGDLIITQNGEAVHWDDLPLSIRQLWQMLSLYPPSRGEQPKFAQYQLPGGENYREVLLTLPLKPAQRFDPAKVEIRRDRRSVTQGGVELLYDGVSLGSYDDSGPIQTNYRQTDEHWMSVAHRLHDRGIVRPDGTRESAPMSGAFTSGHWDEPNVLAHIRMNDREIPADGFAVRDLASGRETVAYTTRDNAQQWIDSRVRGMGKPADQFEIVPKPTEKRVLFIEEIQSDWHQRGRKSGYKPQVTEEIGKLRDEEEALRQQIRQTRGEAQMPFMERLAAVSQQLVRLRLNQAGAVPDAPFKGHAWKKLAIKRVLAYAAERGYDGIAWTTGEQQNARYDLSKHVDMLFWTPMPTLGEGMGVLEAKKDGQSVIEKQIRRDQVADYVGKEIADRLLVAQVGAGGRRRLADLDLKVGGKGMIGFYDRELPNLANDLVKKYGVKVGTAGISKVYDNLTRPYTYEGPEVPRERLEVLLAKSRGLGDEQINGEYVARVDVTRGLNDLMLKLDRGMSFHEAMNYQSISLARLLGGEMVSVPDGGTIDVHYLELPQSAREDIRSKGLPLFQGEKAAVEFAEGGQALIRALAGADISSVAHELSHVARRTLLDRNIPPAQRAGITDDDIAAAEKWAGAKDGKWDRAAEEKFARGFERYLRDGKAPHPTLQALFEKFSKWLSAIYQSIKGSSLDVEISPEMRQVFDRLVLRTAKLAETEQAREAAFNAKADAIKPPSRSERKTTQQEQKAIYAQATAETAQPDAKAPIAVAEHDALFERAREGNATPEEIKAAFERVVRHESAIKFELNKLTKDQIAKRGVRLSSSDTKAQAVSMAYTDMLSDYTLGESYSYNPFSGGSQATGIRAVVEKITPETIAQYAERVAELRQKRAERIEGYKKALTNPETLEEFDLFVKMKKGGESALTAEQRVTYDELRAAAGRIQRKAAEARRATVTAASEQVGATITETKHTKKGYDLFVVQLEKRVERDDYQRLNNAAKKLGGWYSSFRGQGAVPGFQFKTRETAEAFQKLATEGDTTAVKEAAIERREDRRETKKVAAAERLAEMADKLEADAEERQSRDRLVNTARRARMAAGAEAQASADIAMARTLRNLSDAIESGQATHLDGIRTKAQIETLEKLAKQAQYAAIRARQETTRVNWEEETAKPVTVEDIALAEWPDFESTREQLFSVARDLQNVPNSTLLARRLQKLAEQAGQDGRVNVPRETVEAYLDKTTKAGMSPWWWADRVATLKRLEAAGIPDLPTLRAALREYVEYRGAKPQADRVKQLERDLASKGEVGYDFFPTPAPLAARMAEALDVEPGMSVLEPSAGKGNLADAVRAVEPSAEIDVVELSTTLQEILTAKGYSIVGHDFTEFQSDEKYDRIIMNPPFSNGLDAEHVQRAFELLKPGGKLVAITGEGIFFREDAKSRTFRAWFDAVGGTSEQLEGAFLDKREVRTTGVASRLLVVEKPAEASPSTLYQDADPRSEAFARWFGDSKVVDAQGQPLVVYHGTTDEITAFQPQLTGRKTGNKYDGGAVFFTDNPRAASAYAIRPTAGGEFADVHPLDRPNVLPVYLSIQNPLEIDANEKSWLTIGIHEILARARANGHDGVIIRNVFDHASAVTAVNEGAINTYIVFEPTQAKSATGNRGTFDPSNPNILYQDAEPSAPPPVPAPRKTKVITKDELTRLAEWTGADYNSVMIRAEQAGYRIVDGDTPRETNINLDKFPFTTEGREELRKVIEDNDNYIEQRRGVRSWTATRAAAESMAMPAHVPKAGLALNAEQLEALGGHIVTTRERLEDLNRRVAEGKADIGDQARYAQLLTQEQILLETYAGGVAEAGRALNILSKIREGIETEDMKLMRAAIKMLGGHEHLERVAKYLGAFPAHDRIGKYRFIRLLQKPNAADWISWWWFTSLLSGPVTHVRNTLGNTSNLAYTFAAMPATGAMDALRAVATGTPRTAYSDEMGMAWAGAKQGLIEGTRKGLFLLQNGFTMDDVATAEFRPPEVMADSKAAPWLNLVGRALEASDLIFRSIRATSELYAQAHVAAKNAGHKPGSEAGAKFVAEFIAKPPRKALEAIRRETARIVFRDDPKSWLLRGLIYARKDFEFEWHGRPMRLFNPAKFVIPFVQTPAKIMLRSIEATPVGFLTAGARETPREQAQAYGRAALGSALLLPLAALVAQGLVSGAGPDDRELRDQLYRTGWQPHSVKIGDTWYSYLNFQPMALPLSMMANAYEAWIYGGEAPNVMEIVAKTANSVLSQSFMQGLSSLLAALENPGQRAEVFFERTLNSLLGLAGLRGQVARAIDPVVRQPDGLADAVAAGTPGTSFSVRPRLDALGQEATRGGSVISRMFSPVTMSEMRDTPLERELYRLRNDVQIGFPTRTVSIDGETVRLTADEYATLLQESGQEIRQILEARMAESDWDQRTEESRVRAIESAVSDARRKARARLLPAVRERVGEPAAAR